ELGDRDPPHGRRRGERLRAPRFLPDPAPDGDDVRRDQPRHPARPRRRLLSRQRAEPPRRLPRRSGGGGADRDAGRGAAANAAGRRRRRDRDRLPGDVRARHGRRDPLLRRRPPRHRRDPLRQHRVRQLRPLDRRRPRPRPPLPLGDGRARGHQPRLRGDLLQRAEADHLRPRPGGDARLLAGPAPLRADARPLRHLRRRLHRCRGGPRHRPRDRAGGHRLPPDRPPRPDDRALGRGRRCLGRRRLPGRRRARRLDRGVDRERHRRLLRARAPPLPIPRAGGEGVAGGPEPDPLRRRDAPRPPRQPRGDRRLRDGAPRRPPAGRAAVDGGDDRRRRLRRHPPRLGRPCRRPAGADRAGPARGPGGARAM
ncbi:MAG: Mn-Zn_transporter_SitD, partial [uncultured Thermomicrobiales bacterium]